MTQQSQAVELDIRRKSQELAVAWRRGKAAFVLDSLRSEEPLRAALTATLIHDALARWDPYDSKWPNGFRRALLIRSQGLITPEELTELENEYSRTFGSSPPRPAVPARATREESSRLQAFHASRIREALTSGSPIVRERPTSKMFLRAEPARR